MKSGDNEGAKSRLGRVSHRASRLLWGTLVALGAVTCAAEPNDAPSKAETLVASGTSAQGGAPSTSTGSGAKTTVSTPAVNTSSAAGSSSAPTSASTETAPAGDVFEMPKKFKTTKSGLGYVVLKEGTGAKAKKGQTVTVHYTGWLTNGKKFDSSRGGRPFSFKLGELMVIDGWEEGVAMMKVGDKYTFVVPGKLGYGAQGSPPDIPPNATLIFNVELLNAK